MTSKAAALIHGLASTQGFENGNKRTAWFACEAFLEINGFPLRSEISEIVAEVFVQSVANSLIPLDRVEEWLIEHLSTPPGAGDVAGGPTAISELSSLTGDDGELIERFIDLVGSQADPFRVLNAGAFVEWAIGINSPLAGVVVVPEDRDPVPGTLLAERVRVLRRVAPAEWLTLLQDRLSEIVTFGISEDFLITALRNMVTELYENFADVGVAAAKRNRTREDMLAMCEDTVALEKFRQKVAFADPSLGELTLEEFADHLREMAERLFRGPDADEAVNHWFALAAWRTDVATLLSDEVISTWTERQVLPKGPDEAADRG